MVQFSLPRVFPGAWFSLRFSTLFADLNPLERMTWARRDSVLESWFPLQEDGRPDSKQTNELFLEWESQNRLLVDHALPASVGLNAYQSFVPEPLFVRLRDAHPHAKNEAAQLEKHYGRGSLFYGGRGRRVAAEQLMLAPMYLGDDVEIHHGARVVGPVFLGSRVRLHATSSINRSVVRDDTIIKDLTTVSYSLIGKGVQLGYKVTVGDESFPCGGTVKILASRPIVDLRVIELVLGGLYDTHRRRFGAIIGDRCEIGDEVYLAAGTILMPGCKIPPCTKLLPSKEGFGRVYHPSDFK